MTFSILFIYKMISHELSSSRSKQEENNEKKNRNQVVIYIQSLKE